MSVRRHSVWFLVLALLTLQLATATPASAAAGDLSTAAGSIGTGTATSLAIGSRGITVNGTNLYVTDLTYNVIRKIDTTTGTSTVVAGTGIAGYGGDGGAATAAMLNFPADVQFDAAGNMFIADANNNRVRKVSTGGIITTVAGTGVGGTSGDGGPATSATLNNPRAVGIDGLGQMYIEEAFSQAVRKVSAAGVISSLIPSGSLGPRNFAFDAANNVYITMCGPSTVVRYASSGGAGTVVAGTGGGGYSGDGGPATSAALGCPIGIDIDTTGRVYVADNNNVRIRRFTVGGTITTIAGNGTVGYTGDGGPGTSATIDLPLGLAVDASGNVFFAQRNNIAASSTTSTAAIRKVNAGGVISTVAGNSWNGYSGDGGAATSAQLYSPTGVTTDASGNLYVADTQNNRIRKVTGGTISTVAGNGFQCQGGCGVNNIGDGGAATSGNLGNPADVAVTSTGDVIIADTNHNRIRKVSGGVISTIAGNGTAGYIGDGTATSMELSAPTSVAVDSANNIYVADTGNNRIRKIAGTTISTIAGTGIASSTGDGGSPTVATVNGPRSVTVDTAGRIYVADTGGNRVRMIAGGVISTIAGTGTAGYSGDGSDATLATLDAPAGVAVDTAGNVYVSDTGNFVVRRVERHGDIHTVAGRAGSAGYAGDGGAGTASTARLGLPSGLALDPAGSLYIASPSDHRVRKLTAQIVAATWWTSDSTTGHTGVTYAWEFVTASATAIGSLTMTVPSAANTTATGLYLVTTFGLSGSGTLSLSSGLLTYTLPSPVTLPVGQHVYLSVSGFANSPAVDTYASTVTTLTAASATIDVAQSGSIPFDSTTVATDLPVPNPSTTLTGPTSTVLAVDPLNRSDVQVPSTFTLRSTATSGYRLTVSATSLTGVYGTITPVSTGIGTAVTSASFPARRFGYTVSSVGGSASGVAQGALAAGSFAGYTSGGQDVVVADGPTSVTGDTVTVTNRMRVDWTLPAGTYASTVTYAVTPLS